MKVQIGWDYLVIDGMLYYFGDYKDMNVYAALNVLNSIDGPTISNDFGYDDEFVTDEKIFDTPYGNSILKILYAYYCFTDTGAEAGKVQYKQLQKIIRNMEEKHD